MALPILAKGRLTRFLKQFQPQVIHIATPSALGTFAVNYAQKHNIPVLSIYHTHFISYIPYYFRTLPMLINMATALVVKTQRKFYNRCTVIYVPSQSICTELIQLGIKPTLLKLWQRGIDTTLFRPQKRSAAYVQQLTGNSQKNILFASRLVWEKNLQTLINIYHLLQAQHLPYNLIVAGNGYAMEAAKQAMPGAVFTGTLPHQQLAVLYASADVFVFPSVSETFGNVVLEAMAAGLPCIVANGGGSRDFITNGTNGFICEANNAQGYINQIKEIIQNEQLRNTFSQAGLQLSKTFSWQQLAATYFAEVTQLTKHTHSAANAVNLPHQ